MPNTHDNLASSPSPLLRDVGSTFNSSEAKVQLLPLPFPKGCGPAYTHLMGELGKDEHKGGPSKWEAHPVHHKTQAMTFVMVHFCYYHPHIPPY